MKTPLLAVGFAAVLALFGDPAQQTQDPQLQEPQSQGPQSQGPQSQDPQEQKQSNPPGKKAELPELPQKKPNKLEELLRNIERAKNTGAGATKTGSAQGEQTPATAPGSKLDRIAEIVRKAREKRLRAAAGEEEERPIPPNPFLGTWAVTRIVRQRMFGTTGSGWVIFTPTYISMHLFSGGQGPQQEPRWQSSMRRYWVQGPLFMTSSIMGLQNSDDGETILIEESGRRESRRFQFLAPDALRLVQGPNQYLELRRVERF